MRIFRGATVDYEFEQLRLLGYYGSLNDMQFAALRAQGLEGALPDMFLAWNGVLGSSITGTAPVLAALFNTDTLSSRVTWGSYSGTGTVTTTKQMKLGAGSWVAYVGSTVVNTGELWQVQELCSDDVVTDQPFLSSARTVTVAATAPATITVGQWTLADSPSAGGDTLTLTLTALPSDGGSAITAFEYRRNGGTATALGGGLGTGARSITVLATTLANIEVRAVNAIGNGAWSDTKSATPTVSGLYPARFGIGSEQGSGTGAFDTNLYAGGPASNATASGFTVASGVITPDGTQVAGSYTVGGWPITVASGTVAIANQTQWNAITSGSAGKTILVREGAAITSTTAWNSGTDFNWATILGDGEDPRVDYSSGKDSRKHLVSFSSLNQKKLIFDRLRVVTGSAAGAKVPGIRLVVSGEGNTVRDIHVLRCVVIASRPDPFGDYTGGTSSFPGDEGIYFDQDVARVSVRDNVVIGACGTTASIDLQPVTGYAEIVGNSVDLHYADGFAVPSSAVLFGGNIISRPMSLPGDSGGPHCDGVQFLGVQGVTEASAFIQGSSRGAWQSFFSSGTPVSLAIRNIFTSDKGLYQISISNTVGCEVNYCTWVPKSGEAFPLSNPQGGLRFGSLISGTNDLKNSIHRSESNVDAGVTKTGNVVAQTWVSADWTTAFPNWDMATVPTLQNALQYHAAPSGGGAAAGKGASQNITSWGSERSSYVLNYTTPTVSSITITPTVDGFTGTLRTNVGNNMVYYCVIPQADPNPTWREIKEQRVANSAGYGSVWCGRDAASTDLAIAISTASPGTAYKFCAVAENGWSVQSTITTSNFTTASAGISKIATGAVFSANSTTSIVMDIPSSGVMNGDYLVAIIAHAESSAEPTTPAGWTLIGNGVGWTTGSPAAAVYGRIRDGSEGATLTITTAANQRVIGFVTALRTVSGAGVEATVKVFNGTSRATPTLTATANSAILHIWAHNSYSGTVTLPNPSDLVASGQNPDGNNYLGAELLLSTSAGVTAARTATSTTSATWNAMQVELLKA